MILINPTPTFDSHPKNILTLHDRLPPEYLNLLRDKSITLNFKLNDGLYNSDKSEAIPTYTPKSSAKLEYNNENSFYPLYKNLHQIILDANKEHFNYNIDSFIGPLYINKYFSNNCSLGWHSDIGDKQYSHRKLSIVIMLSNPNNFKGGILEMFVGETKNNPDPIKQLILKQGDIVIFPSYIPHRVTPVTDGERLTIIGFVGNNTHFK